jgi:hypothetical protein
VKPRKVRCPTCKAEEIWRPGIVGEVVELRGRLVWHGFDPASARELANFTDDGISDPPQARHIWVEIASEPLTGECRRHGSASVSPADVVS